MILIVVQFHLQSLIPKVPGQDTGEAPAAPGRNSPPLPLSPKSVCSGRWREDRASSLSFILPASLACSREGSVRFQWHLLTLVLSPSNSLILLTLLTSCLSSGNKGQGPSHCCAQCCWPGTGVRAWHTLQPGTGTSTFPLQPWAAAESSWGQSLESSWFSAGWTPLLPGWAARDSLAFL